MDEIRKELEKFLYFPPISDQIGAKPHFGRLILHDERSKEHPLRKLANKLEKPSVKKRYARKWRSHWQGNQGQSSMCTAFSFLHFFEHEPINHPRSYGKYKGFPHPVIDPRILYCEAQNEDPWPGGCSPNPANDAYDGTSVLAMMKVAQRRGYISEYAWEYSNVDNVINALLNVGPVIAGTNWYRDMELRKNDPNTKEALLLPTGGLVGGHAYLIDEYDSSKARKGREFGIFNSWGPSWGWNGRAFISIETLEQLMREDGEICLATECE